MPVCPAVPCDVLPAAAHTGLGLLGEAGMVAVRVADLHSPARAGLGKDGSSWREAVGPGPVQGLRDRLLAGIDAEHRQHDYRAVTVGDLDACSIDGSLTRVPDTPANREAFGSAGTADDSSPYPQLREL